MRKTSGIRQTTRNRTMTMEGYENGKFRTIYKMLTNGELGTAMTEYEKVSADMVNPLLQERFQQIRNDYRLMLDFLLRGFRDTERDRLYSQLIVRFDQLVADTDTNMQTENSQMFANIKKNLAAFSAQHDEVYGRLEAFVTDMAMTELEEEAIQDLKQKDLYERHYSFMSKLFEHIWLSPQWSDDDMAAYERLLLSPTIERNDIMLILSAVFLANSQCFDARKTLLMVNISAKATDEHIRQRALVGWALTLDERMSLYPKLTDAIREYCGNDGNTQQLVELQKQLYFCLNAERDNEAIQKDIMPDIIKNSNLNITRFGIEEKDEDTLQNILTPEAQEEAIDKVEQSFRKMVEMQKAGSDIYFGGFSQMKRFSFFFQTANWFAPFDVNHPAIKHVTGSGKQTAFIQALLKSGPFCDSDKYSFVLAMSNVFDRLPDNITEMMNGESMFEVYNASQDTESPVYIRRMYLQDLYRFFKLYTNKQLLHNPFNSQHGKRGTALFIDHSVFCGTIADDRYTEIGQFLLRRNNTREAWSMIERLREIQSDSLLELRAQCLYMQGKGEEAEMLYRKVVEKNPDDAKAISALAKITFQTGRYDEAVEYYKHLQQQYPDKLSYQLNYCVALSKTPQVAESIETLYRLYYENPDNHNVLRVLAWNLLVAKRTEQAGTEYEKLLQIGDQKAEDWLNAGYYYLIVRNVEKAVDMFRRYVEESKSAQDARHLIGRQIAADADVLLENDIDKIEMQLIVDLVMESM
ncbi:MAG: tetratricopeptide repeat protein [Prevotella sp.]|nr:tetratricopeptide repeat protein [Prevotella sp.]